MIKQKFLNNKTTIIYSKYFVLIVIFLSQSFFLSAQTQKISLSLQNVTLKELFSEIEKKSEVHFSYIDQTLDNRKNITLSVTDESVESILNRVLPDIGFEYVRTGNTIAVKPKTQPNAQGLQKIISGIITGEDGEPIIGASVLVKGTNNGVITDLNGAFSISVYEDAVLIVTYIGYIPHEIPVRGKTALTILLQEDTQTLDEVVIIGYGTQKKINLTGAIASVDKKTFQPRAVVNTAQYLQGAIANLNISNSDGGPGAEPSYNIRGYSGLGSSYAPLVVVDGFTGSLKEVNPNDIESVTVLKDAASAAIYGAQAAYGVILITTKMGKKNSRPTATYSGNLSYNTPVTLPKTAGSIEFASLMREASLNEGGTGIFSEETLARIEQYYYSPGSIPNTVPQANDPTRWSNWGDGQCNANEDWYKAMFKPQINQMHNIEIAGGGANTSYLMSLGVLRDEGKLRYYDDNYTRYNADLKVSSDINRWLTVNMNIRYVREENVTPSYYFGSSVNELIGWAAMMWPTQPVKDPNGHFTPEGRMAFINQSNPNEAIGDKLSANVTAIARITPDLVVNGGIAFNKYAFRQTSSRGIVWAWTVDNEPYMDGGSSPDNTQVWQSTENNDYFSSNVYTTYAKGLGGHNIKAMVGAQMEYSYSYGLSGNKTRLVSPSIPSISTAIGTPAVSDALDHWTTMSYFGRLNYDYLQRYLLEFNIRHDGSSRYASKSVSGSPGRWGTFPSVSIGWNIAKESFFSESNDQIGELKLRASFGELGNMRGKSYQYISTIDYNSTYGYIMDGQRIGAFGSPDLIAFNTWEKNRTLDFGIDIAALKNRLTFSYDWYRKDIIGLITMGEVLPAILGANAPATNSANIRNVGFELSVGWRGQFTLKNKPFSYNVNGILSDYQGEVKKYSNPRGIIGNWDGGVPRIWSNYYVGAKMGEIWGFETGHLVKTQEEADALNLSGAQSQIGNNWTIGDMVYEDLNGDGKITDGSMTLDDHGDLKIIGNSTPRYSFGLQLGASWNNFDISVLFQGVGKRDLWLYGNTFQGVGYFSTGSNVWMNTLDCYRNDGSNPDPYWPKFYLSDHGWKNLRSQTKYLQNAAYCRLKNLRIGYSIPGAIINKIGISNLYIYASGDNLLTFTKLNENIDPENPWSMVPWQSGNLPYPLSKSFAFGLNVSF